MERGELSFPIQCRSDRQTDRGKGINYYRVYTTVTVSIKHWQNINWTDAITYKFLMLINFNRICLCYWKNATGLASRPYHERGPDWFANKIFSVPTMRFCTIQDRICDIIEYMSYRRARVKRIWMIRTQLYEYKKLRTTTYAHESELLVKWLVGISSLMPISACEFAVKRLFVKNCYAF